MCLHPGALGGGVSGQGETQLGELRVVEVLQAHAGLGLVGVAGVVLQTVGEHQLHVLHVLGCKTRTWIG